jgi:NAD-dependent dihydropyrimidine dehydrogenase PreA subunit
MCEFCHKHGEGKKWYLAARHYSEDLLSDLRRRKFIEEFYNHPDKLVAGVDRLRQLEQAPQPIRGLIRWVTVARQKSIHYGQVLPIEEVEKIFEMSTSIHRVACICRHNTLKKEARYCYGVSVGPNGNRMAELLGGLDESFVNGVEAGGIERLDKRTALEAVREHEREGLCHTVWTFRTPFIGGICNCDRTDCLAMKATVTHDVPVMFRAEYVATVRPDACNGCRLCMRLCQFGAMGYSAGTRSVWIDPRRCYGCGICRSVCKPNAIALRERAADPVAAQRW